MCHYNRWDVACMLASQQLGGAGAGYAKKSMNVLTYATANERTPERVRPSLRHYANRLGNGLTQSWTQEEGGDLQMRMQRSANHITRNHATFLSSDQLQSRVAGLQRRLQVSPLQASKLVCRGVPLASLFVRVLGLKRFHLK